MLTTKKTFQTKFLSTLLILALVSTMILAPTALAAGFGGSSITPPLPIPVRETSHRLKRQTIPKFRR